MDSSKDIKSKRDKIRMNLKETLVKSGHLMSQHLHSPVKINQNPKNTKVQKQATDSPPLPTVSRTRRKTSLDIRVMGNDFDMFECNQILIFNQFYEMYDIIRKIDEGMESVVYEASQKSTKLIYAVKVFKKKDQDIINRLKTQFRILKNLNHPNIIKAYNLFINEKIGLSHLVLQYCSYLNLRFHMLKSRTLKETQIAEILSYLLSAIAYLHNQGICHRDIKPQNILFDPITRNLKLIDFQISKMIKYNHQKLEMLTGTGTIYYRAPQMLVSGMYSQMIDIWAVGVICYEMLTGDFPFKHLYQNEVSRLIKQTQPRYDLPNITDLCINFVKKCLQKDPLKRFTAAEALKSPFILKYSSVSSNSSPMRRKNSEQNLRNICQTSPFEFQVNKCFDEDSGLKNRQSLQVDNGIRLVMQQKRVKTEYQ